MYYVYYIRDIITNEISKENYLRLAEDSIHLPKWGTVINN